MCKYCLKPVCPPGCPNYVPPKSDITCVSCGESIYPEEEYIENENGETCHYECFDGLKDLLRFLGYKVKKVGPEVTGDKYWWL